jgi:alpha-D-ribose 1-methylphosphonate 5-triphosphate diphosphatase
MKRAIINANIVLKDTILKNEALVIDDGCIEAIAPLSTAACKINDFKGAYLVPGLIDLHCDAIEGVIEPRAGVQFPLDFGITQMDRINVLAGITTSFNSISFADGEFGVRGVDMASQIVRAVKAKQGTTLVENRVHCRYEITEPAILGSVLELIAGNQIDILSFMDHTPGQGQFKETVDYINYQRKNYGLSPEEIDRRLEKKQENRKSAVQRLTKVCDYANKRSITLISHDDDSPKRVRELKQLGISISEFPINMHTAKEAKNQNITTIFGAPNTLRGKSQSGSMRAIEAIANNVADCLCSDYFPSTLIPAVFMLPETVDLTLSEAVKMVTLNPAEAVGLSDRGEIAEGKLADLVGVRKIDDQYQIVSTWKKGKKVFYSEYH